MRNLLAEIENRRNQELRYISSYSLEGLEPNTWQWRFVVEHTNKAKHYRELYNWAKEWLK